MDEPQKDANQQTSIGSDSDSKPVIRKDESFYFADVVFLVERCLFKVPRAYFERDSEVFCALFQLPVAQNVPVEGSSDQQPLRLEGIKEDDFRQLLRVMYPRHAGQQDIMSCTEWTSVLKLSTMWSFDDLRDLAIQNMSELSIDPVERAALAKEFNVDEWLLPALNELAQREDPIRIDEARRLGWETALQIAAVRESFVAWNEKVAFGPRGARTQIDFTARIRAILDIP